LNYTEINSEAPGENTSLVQTKNENGKDIKPISKYYFPRRFLVVGMMSTGLAIVYGMRVNITFAILDMEKEYKWSSNMQGIVLSAFYMGYITTQIIGGYLSTKFGGKYVIGGFVFMAACMTILCPFVADITPLLILVRILTGVSSGASFPTVQNLLSRWIPPNEMNVSSGISFCGAQIGTIIADLVLPLLMKNFGWRIIFYSTGGIAIVWVVLWVFLSASNPSGHWFIHRDEVEYIAKMNAYSQKAKLGKVPWLKMFSLLSCWAIYVSSFATNYTFYTLLNWLPSYLNHELGLSLDLVAIVPSISYAGSVILQIVGGRISDYLQYRGYVKSITLRKTTYFLSAIIPALCLIVLSLVSLPVVVASILMIIAVSVAGLSYLGTVINILELSPRYAGVLYGISNTGGTIPGIVGVYLVGVILETPYRWSLVFQLSAAVSICGCAFYTAFADPAKQID